MVASWADRKSKTIIILKCRLLFFYTTKQAISQSECVMRQKEDFIWQPAITTSVGGPKRSSKALAKAKLAPKKWLWSLFGGLLPIYPLQLSESRRNHYIWEVYWENWWDGPKTAKPAANTGQQNEPNFPRQCWTAHHTTNASKVEQMGLRSFASWVIFTWHLTKQLPLLQASWQLFAGKTLPQLLEAEYAFQEFTEIRRMDFYAAGINKLFSHWQKYVDYIGCYLTNRDVFETSYNC